MINLLPMAGRGNRFFQEKYNLAKPFIPILNQPMLNLAVKSFPKGDRYIFIALKEHIGKYPFESLVKTEFQNAEVISVDEPTEGQACTCLLAESKLKADEGLFIASCDYQTIYDVAKYRKLMTDPSVDVIIWTFKLGTIKNANPLAFAYCKTEGERVTEVVEKRLISDNPRKDHAVVGSFTYKRAEQFVSSAKKMISKNIRINGEFYVGTSINQLIAGGCRVVIFEVEKFISFGNPFELQLFDYWQDYFDQLEDHPYKIERKFKSPSR